MHIFVNFQVYNILVLVFWKHFVIEIYEKQLVKTIYKCSWAVTDNERTFHPT